MRRFGRFFREILLPVMLAAWVAYMGYGAIAGATGYKVLADLKEEAAKKRAALDEITARRRALEKHASLLNPRSVDPDMLDERVRAVLGYAHPEDIVVPRAELERMLEEARQQAAKQAGR